MENEDDVLTMRLGEYQVRAGYIYDIIVTVDSILAGIPQTKPTGLPLLLALYQSHTQSF